MQIAAEWVQFEIPYLLQVEDSFEGNEDARFYPRIADVPAELQFKKEARDDEKGDRPGMMFGMVKGDRLGNVSYTKVNVGFDRQFLDSLPKDLQSDFENVKEGHPTKWLKHLDGREGYIIQGAVDYVNRFLEIYRAALGYTGFEALVRLRWSILCERRFLRTARTTTTVQCIHEVD